MLLKTKEWGGFNPPLPHDDNQNDSTAHNSYREDQPIMMDRCLQSQQVPFRLKSQTQLSTQQYIPGVPLARPQMMMRAGTANRVTSHNM